MKREINVLLFGLLATLVSCTDQAKLAQQSMDVGVRQMDSIVYDLATIARQAEVDRAVAAARTAAANHNPDAAQAAVENYDAQSVRIHWLAMDQYNKAREVLRFAQRHIMENRNIISVYKEHYALVKTDVDNKKPPVAAKTAEKP